MCRFSDEHFGKPLNPKISDFLHEYIKPSDRAEIAQKHDYADVTVQRVVNGKLALTYNNSKVIISLMERAVKNCGNIIEQVKKDRESFKAFRMKEFKPHFV